MGAICNRALQELTRMADECYVGKVGNRNIVVVRIEDGFIPVTKNSDGWVLNRPFSSLKSFKDYVASNRCGDLSLKQVPKGFVVS